MPLEHHGLCFGCGQSNLFGLLLEVERTGEGAVAGRWFVKQDHQGPAPGSAHPGLLATVLVEAAMLAGGPQRHPGQVQFELEPGAALRVGSFCDIQAEISGNGGDPARARAAASVDGRQIARLTCSFMNIATGKEST